MAPPSRTQFWTLTQCTVRLATICPCSCVFMALIPRLFRTRVPSAFIATRAANQNGGEGTTPAEFTPDLLAGFKYFGNRLCPFANRAYWALAAKGLLADGSNAAAAPAYIHVNLGSSKPAWYKVRHCVCGLHRPKGLVWS